MKKTGYILFVLSAVIFIIAHSFDKHIITNIVKPIPLIILIILVNRNSLYNKLIITGFVFSLLGDILLMETIDMFVFGLIGFLIAHVFYIIAFFKQSSRTELLSSIPFYIYGIIFYIFLYKSLREMAIPVAFYMLIITTMLWRSFVQRNSSIMTKWAWYGAVLFTFSDSMIAVSKFDEPFFLSSIFIMITYWGGQFLIYWSTNPLSVPNSNSVK